MHEEVSTELAGYVPPAARSMSEFSFTEVGDEYILFDNDQLAYHTLNQSAHAIWRLCDGNRSLAEIAELLELPVSPDSLLLIKDAVTQLHESSLLMETANSEPAPRFDRRRLIKSAAVAGIAIPLISSISAPVAADGVCACGTLDPGSACGQGYAEKCSTCCCCLVGSSPQCGDPDYCNTYLGGCLEDY